MFTQNTVDPQALQVVPVLSAGMHPSPREGACIMELASFLDGAPWSDAPACTHPVLAELARAVNDRLDDVARQELLPLLPRLLGTAGGVGDQAVSVQLAVWCARQVQHLTTVPEAETAAAAAERWAGCPCTAHGRAAQSASAAIYGATLVATTDWDDASYCAANAALIAVNAATSLGADATYAGYVGIYAAGAAETEDLPGLLSGAIDEYDRLTGRTTHPEVTAVDLARCAALTAA